jgi:deoxyribodipyrimidine photo-lyase
MTGLDPILLWFRRDLRIADHPALSAAAETGRPVIPVFLADEVVETHGAAPKWRLGLGVAHFAERLGERGSRLTLRRGPALASLRDLVRETGAASVWWTRAYDPASRQRDEGVKAGLKADGIDARSFPGHVLFEPWTVETGQGGYYKVFTPFWKAVRARDPGAPLPPPDLIAAPATWPQSDALESWDLGHAMRRGARVVLRHVTVGEAAGYERLDRFIAGRVERYAEDRDHLGLGATSGLSENLTYGEVSVRACWHAGLRARADGKRGAEKFLQEIVWRDFAYHLIHHTPHIVAESWREDWRDFPWDAATARPQVDAWKRARTGIEVVDAALREMFVTGTMHNRARMIVASYLTKHLRAHWRIGQRWFEECLIDWDPAANAMGWQWVAGSGPDAAPYFRVFNPETQAEKFDAERTYRRRWIAEGQPHPPDTAQSYFDAIPEHWGLRASDAYPAPIVTLAEGRARALADYAAWKG